MKINLEGARKILHTGDIPRVCSDEEQTYLAECLKLHPKAVEKLGDGIRKIWIRSSLYGTRGFFIERMDGTEEDFSIYKCFRKAMSKTRSSFRTAARFAANVAFIDGFNLHHSGEWSFEVIVKEFIRINKIDIEAIEYDHSGLGVRFADKTLAKRFKEFHDLRAVLIPLTDAEHYDAHFK